jgi:molybdenum cofactor guanylyltransferase
MEGRRDLAAFVLAGGKSSRMGTDKAFLEYRGRTLLFCALESARSVSSAVCIVGSRAKFESYGPVIEDVFVGRGPLGGIQVALSASRAELNLVIAVDMPLLSREFLRYLVDRARNSTAIVTVPRTDGRWQPLCAVYRASFLTLAEDALQAGTNKIDPLFAMTQVLTIEDVELKEAGFSPLLFRNINSPQDLLELLQEKRS